MKKIFIALTLAAATLTSCDMDLERAGSIGTDNGIQTKADCQSFLNGLYNNLRSATGGLNLALPEFQADMFQATVVNGNNYGDFAFGTITPGTTELEDRFYNPYVYMANINFFIPRAQAVADGAELSEADKAEVEQMIAVAKFARAYYNTYLFTSFCPAYTAEKAETPALGIPLVTEYNPSPDRGSYPGRSTMKETIDFINQDLKDAYTVLKDYENNYSKAAVAPNAAYVSSYAVEALQARVALLSLDYDTAIAKAEDVINSGIYPLCEIANYNAMWVNDASTELIFVPFGSQAEAAGIPATGSYWLYSSQLNTSYFIPSSEAIAQYDANDIRGRVFFDEFQIDVNGDKVDSPVFYKFPGNPELWTSTVTNFRNKPKPFRTSELYLIAAEAYNAKGDATNANKYINDLRAKRISNYTAQNMSGNTLTDAIRSERCKELLGEGFRLNDLKRWGLGFTRTCNYGEVDSWYDGLAETLLYPRTRTLSYSANDYRYVWPIPQSEIEVNPQLNGQQNAGY